MSKTSRQAPDSAIALAPIYDPERPPLVERDACRVLRKMPIWIAQMPGPIVDDR